MERAAIARACIAAMMSMAWTAIAYAVELQPGLYEIATKSERDGVVTQRQSTKCITPDQARDIIEHISGQVVSSGEQSVRTAACKIVDISKGESKLTWRRECSGTLSATQTGRYVIDGPQRFTSEMTSSVTIVGVTVRSVLTTEGRWAGECPK
jgi:hypothetical protein